MKSISKLSYRNIETILVGRYDHMPQYENCTTVSPTRKEFLNGYGINYGVEKSSGDYLFILNDDVVLDSECITPLLEALIGLPVIGQVMPIGNDQQGRYHIPSLLKDPADKNIALEDWDTFPFRGVPLRTGQIFCDTLCLYAHMLPRKVWDKVGPMDDSAGLIDLDYSLRMRQAGKLNAIELSSLVWHFGGVSVEKTLDGQKRVKQKDQFEAKWGWRP